MQNKKSQVASLDLILASVVFLFIVIVVFTLWNRYSVRLDETTSYNSLELTATQILDLLIKNPGVPETWEDNPEDVLVLGLGENRVISSAKVFALMNLSYNMTKELLNIERYEYYMLFKKQNQSIFEIGEPLTLKKAVKLKRYVIYENTPSSIEFALRE